MKRAARTILAGAVTGFLIVFVTLSAQAHPAHFYQLGNDSFEAYRPPWREREAWYIDGGKGVGEHDPSDPYEDRQYAIDLNKPGGDNGAPLRADRSGEAVFYPTEETGGEDGYGNLLGILHSNGQSSWYAHLRDDTPVPPPDSEFVQGEYAAKVDNTGRSEGDHLHFQVHDNWNRPDTLDPYNTTNICMAGTCPGTGFDLQHLSQGDWHDPQSQRATYHPSNNTGPGYGRPGAPAHLDPGPETSPLSGQIAWIARIMVALGGEPGSTFASLQGACAANRHWVKSCEVGYTQNFLEPTGSWLSVPQSITEGPNGAQLVRSATWKAYGRQCGTGGFYAYQQIGRPTGGEWGAPFVKQNFQYGQITRDQSDPTSVTVRVYGLSGNLMCTFTGLNSYHTGPCYDVDGNGMVRVADMIAVLNNYGLNESDSDYDDRYDINRDGMIRIADVNLVIDQYGKDCT